MGYSGSKHKWRFEEDTESFRETSERVKDHMDNKDTRTSVITH